jgi:DNA end-binding protein Ku
MARAIGSATISFGLVSIPVRLFVATHSQQPRFHLVHAECGSRIRNQLYCPRDKRVVERSEVVRGYEFQRDRYVTFTDKELKAIEAAASESIDIEEFVPLEEVDPIYFEDSHYLGPDKGAEKAYHLLSAALHDTGRVAVTQYVARGKEHLALIRPYDGALILHTLYYADEVRPLEVATGSREKLRPTEVELARKLVDQLSTEKFRPERYADRYRERLREIVKRKAEGEEAVTIVAERKPSKVIDLVEALKRSVARGRREAGAEEARQPTRRAGRHRRAGGRVKARG